MKVVWLSAGISSFIAGYLVRDSVDAWIYIDVADQHPDSLRFIKDCEKILNTPIIILKSDKYENVEDVCKKTGMVNSPWGAPCTGMLKKAVRKKWENEQRKKGVSSFTYVWGYDDNEIARARTMINNNPEYNHEFPLIENNLSKENAHALAKMVGIKRPVMYDMGYHNNNCIGCVKGGMWYWNKIRNDFPDVFEKRKKMERDIGHSCINGIFLDELPKDKGRKQDEIKGDCDLMCGVFIRRNNGKI